MRMGLKGVISECAHYENLDGLEGVISECVHYENADGA